MKKLVFLPFLFLVGCKVEIITPIQLSKVSTNDTFEAVLNLEVPACNNYKDSRKMDDTLIKLLNKVETDLPELNYIECYSVDMESLASFEIKGKYLSFDDIQNHSNEINVQIASNSNEKETKLYFVVPKSLRDKIHQLEEENYVSFSPSITVEVENDTDNKKSISGVYSYVNNHPSDLQWGGVTDINNTNTITFSNVMADRLLLDMDKDSSNAVYFMSFGAVDEE